MPDYLFYHLGHAGLKEVLPVLLERSLDRQWRCIVKGAETTSLKNLSDWLWTVKERSFLAHALDGDADMQAFAADQPIWLTRGDERPNEANILFLVDGAEPLHSEAYDRIVYIFDGQDTTAVNQARDFWKRLSDQGQKPTYWQQNEAGGWEQRG